MNTRLTIPVTVSLNIDDNDDEHDILEGVAPALRSFFVRERNVHVVIDHLGILRTELISDQAIYDRLVEAVGRSTADLIIRSRSPHKIAAIKSVREHTNLSLVRAKEFIETYAL